MWQGCVHIGIKQTNFFFFFSSKRGQCLPGSCARPVAQHYATSAQLYKLTNCAAAGLLVWRAREAFTQLVAGRFGVAEQHLGVGVEEERVGDLGVS